MESNRLPESVQEEFAGIPDLWPKRIPEVKSLGPCAILKMQAVYLSRRTKDVIQAQIDTSGVKSLRHIFKIVAPCLNYYECRLLTVECQNTGYPCKVFVQWPDDREALVMPCEDDAAFMKLLKEVFADEVVLQVVGSLRDASLKSETVETWSPATGRAPRDLRRPYEIIDGKCKIKS